MMSGKVREQTTVMASGVCNVLLVYPRFDNPSFWQLKVACELAGRRCIGPPLGLITVAALLPPEWEVRLVDRNAEELTDDDLDWADLVMTGGMIPQQPDTLRVIELCNARGKTVAVGGPDATSSPQIYRNADIRVIGEAEGLMGEFVRSWNAGNRSGVFEAEKFKTDVTTSPVPRFDLLKPNYYLDAYVQFSRGCPFTCEFCDIIELYGRVPRTKTTEQMLAELDALYELGHRGNVVFVDDNLIGNKKAVKSFLPHLCEWQKKHGYPFSLATQASVNLADDDGLLALMREANFWMVFIGIETPDPDVLVTTQKKQNTRRNLAACMHKIYSWGIVVTAGFIVGFDGEKDGIAEEMIACIEAADIPLCMVGLLTALPNTQLVRRLEREGRLDAAADVGLFEAAVEHGDQCTGGLNFKTSRPRRDILADYRLVLQRVYEPSAYFGRVRELGRLVTPPKRKVMLPAKVIVDDVRTLGRLARRLATRHRELIPLFCANLFDCAIRNPAALKQVMIQMVVYLHAGPFARYVVEYLDRQIATLDAEDDNGPVVAAPVAAPSPGLREDAGKAVASVY
jgi:radical SAM superfamily enzyme YgiQ (UPF0313 family)